MGLYGQTLNSPYNQMNILKQYKASLKSVEVEEVVELFFYRPLAFFLVKSIYNTNLTPNQLTLAGLVFGVAGGIILAGGYPGSMFWAAVLFIVFNVLDCSDGQLARLKRNGTPMGRILDGIADYLVSASAYFGMGFGFANSSSTPLFYWGLILATAASNIIHAVLVDYYRNKFLDYTQPQRSVLDSEFEDFQKKYEILKIQKGNGIQKIVIGTYLKYSAMQRKLALTNKKQFDVSPSEYDKENKRLIHLWTYLGPATQWSFMIICLLFNRIEAFLWGIIIVFNILAIGLYINQQLLERKFRRGIAQKY
jgi:phosphatidylglycerophosphate synthase